MVQQVRHTGSQAARLGLRTVALAALASALMLSFVSSAGADDQSGDRKQQGETKDTGAGAAKEGGAPADKAQPLKKAVKDKDEPGALKSTAAPAPGEPQSAGSSPTLHRVHMRLSGTTCVACLLELERKLKAMKGIKRVKVERPDQTSYGYFSAPGASWSEATIIYDPEIAPLSSVNAFLKGQGFHPWKVVDKVSN